MLASYQGHLEVVKLLLEEGAKENINKPDDNNSQTGLSLTSLGMELLYERDGMGEINHHDTNARTALMLASQQGHLEVVKLLLEEGAKDNINPPYQNGQTALMLASQEGHLEVVKLLLQQGAKININYPDQNGQTALMLASHHRHLEVVKLLFQHGAIRRSY
jgi:serine/threonine-protein phosphatase 6 regulatory ankyrin repeat subunit B